MKITEDPGTGLRDLTEEDSPAEDLIKEKEIGGADPDQDPPEEISAETILSQDSEERVLIKNTTKEIQGKIREETDRDLEIDKDPHQLETTPHHQQQEDPILHSPQKEIHHHSSESQVTQSRVHKNRQCLVVFLDETNFHGQTVIFCLKHVPIS